MNTTKQKTGRKQFDCFSEWRQMHFTFDLVNTQNKANGMRAKM